jgi:hypothetical protein
VESNLQTIQSTKRRSICVHVIRQWFIHLPTWTCIQYTHLTTWTWLYSVCL